GGRCRCVGPPTQPFGSDPLAADAALPRARVYVLRPRRGYRLTLSLQAEVPPGQAADVRSADPRRQCRSVPLVARSSEAVPSAVLAFLQAARRPVGVTHVLEGPVAGRIRPAACRAGGGRGGGRPGAGPRSRGLRPRRQGRSSSTRLNGVAVARRNRVKPACVTTSRSRFSPACAPSASPTSWASDAGVQIIVDAE